MSLPHVLLGLLARGPASGWDLKTRLSRDPAYGWDADLAQIYPALSRLLRGGFVAKKRRRSTKGPARLEYRLTPAGKKEFQDWLAEPPQLPRAKDPALARLAFLERRAVDDRESRLHAYRSLVAEALKKAAPGATAARRRRRALLETELAWADAEMLLLATQLRAREERERVRKENERREPS
ncbi:MAG: PadR family transcriptional regulator [Acidobacteria bacterium]|nr:PadR family transcriptional regulator [Acidobacteriota bacterium]